MPRVSLARDRAGDPLVDGADQAGLPGERQEHRGQAEPVLGVVPADKRLKPDDGEILDIDEWLPVED